MKKHKAEAKTAGPGQEPPFDIDLAVASHELDATADKEWFIRHQAVTKRLRPATALEMAALMDTLPKEAEPQFDTPP